MSDIVVFKGSRFGVRIIFAETADFELILQCLREKLSSAVHFFSKGTTFCVDRDKVTAEQKRALENVLDDFELKLELFDDRPQPEVKIEQAETETVSNDKDDVRIIDRTVRGGQEIMSKGSVIILGNVNPGAKIVAGGNIEIKGTCRGFVHAGAFGNREATVMAERMMAGQIRIADRIACAPEKAEEATCAERARIKDGNIIIEPINRQEVS